MKNNNGKQAMNIDKYTFGKTPAAMYLVHYLNKLDNRPVLTRVGKVMTGFRNTLAELSKANEQLMLSAHNLSRVVNSMREGFQVDVGDEMASNLVTNILVGEMKSVLRKAAEIRKIELHQNKINYKTAKVGTIVNKNGYDVAEVTKEHIDYPVYTVDDVADTINAETLTEKWQKKMVRRKIIIEN